jgi:protein ImuA
MMMHTLRADIQSLQAKFPADMPLIEVKAALQASPTGLETVLRNPAIWRATQVTQANQGIATGYSALDKVLPDSGWPAGALTELLVSVTGAGELSLVLPALRAICAEGKGIALVGAPYLPQARAWQEAGIPLERLLIVDAEGNDLLWSAEQILRSGECGAVLLWGQAAGRALTHRALQRLHLAAGAGNALCFLYRPITAKSVAAETSPSPAPLRLRLSAQAGDLHLHVAKCRGVTQAKPIPVKVFPAHWHTPVVSAVPSSTAAYTPAASKASAPVETLKVAASSTASSPPRSVTSEVPVTVQLALV